MDQSMRLVVGAVKEQVVVVANECLDFRKRLLDGIEVQ
jgi:hypothetical protein